MPFCIRAYWRSYAFRAVTGVLLLTAFAQADAQSPTSTLLQEQAETLEYTLNKQPAEQVTQARYGCATGNMPRGVAKFRSAGFAGTPDAADSCVTVLYRLSQEGKLAQYYQAVLIEQNGQSDGYESLPAAIGAAVMKDRSNQVPIGNQKALVVTASLALDAGFTVAFQSGIKLTAGMPALAVLKPIAERCLSQQEANLGLCYSTGYVYGARAVSRAPLTELQR